MNTNRAEAIPFRQLPLLVRLTTMATLFMLWVLIEELFIDRHGLDIYLPLYRVAETCVYDLAVAAMLLAVWRRLHADRARGP